MLFRTLLVCLLVALLSCAAQAEEVRLRCTANTNLSSYETERDLNYGKSARLRLKGIEMLALFQFDTAPVAGWNVEKATLYLRYAGNDRKLRTLGISTISALWQEGTGTAEQKPGETCFDWSAFGQRRWAGPDTDFTDVSFTTGHTLASYADLKVLNDGWIAVPVEPRLVQALIAGVSYGLAVTDEKGQTAANNDIFSREQSGSEPYLVVQGSPGSAQLPAPVQNVKLAADSRHADFSSGALRLTFLAPRDAFAYEVTCTPEGAGAAQRVPRYTIPFATPGQPQTLSLKGLAPAARQAVEIVPISATGVRGAAMRAIGISSAAEPKPAPLPAPPNTVLRAQEPPLHSGLLRLWAYPDTEKAEPVSGNLLEEVGSEKYAGPPAGDYRRANTVWEGGTIRLFAARSEFVGVHLLIEAANVPLKGVTVHAPETFQNAAGRSAWKPRVTLFRDWYVRDGSDWFPEVCVPLTTPFDIPAADNAVPGQRNQSVFVDLYVPRDVAPGLYRSELLVSAEGVSQVRVPIEITVNSLTLPDTLSFDISLNTYGTVGHLFGIDDTTPAYRALEREYHRMAYLHRATLAILGYSHSNNFSTNYAPPLEGSGANLHVQDWTAWDTQFGPYLDGSAFADLPRRGVPISHFYLPFHEAWPVDIRTHYHYQQTTNDYPALIAEHALQAPPIEQAFDPEVGEGFVAVARQFAEHFRAKGWTRTQFQFYQNDKYYYKDPKMGGRGTSWWLLDEPNHRDDWLALAYFARFFRQGIQAVAGVSMLCREDISRPQWQRDYLDGLVDLMVVSGELYTKGPLLRDLQERLGVRYWNYGTANAVRRSNTEAEAWAVRAWLAGADGIVPWQSVGEEENYTRAEPTALLLPGKRFGMIGPVASLRLKALRRAQQDAEYLVLLAAAQHWDRAQVAAALDNILAPQGTFAQNNAEDAGSYRFDSLRASDFEAMRRAAAEAIGKMR
jgi:hypothetical protein